MTDVELGAGDPRRATAAALGCLGLGVVLVVAGVATGDALDATTTAGAAVALVGLVLLARLPRSFDRSVLSVHADGVAWSGVGAADWSAPWAEVTGVRLARARRTAYVVVALRDGDVPLPCRPGVLPDLRSALARHAPGVPVEGGSPGPSGQCGTSDQPA